MVSALSSFDLIVKAAETNQKFDLYLINDIYRSIFPSIQLPFSPYDCFRTSDSLSSGGRSRYVPAGHLKFLMPQFIGNINWQIEQNEHKQDFYLWLAELHWQFENLHPYPDGNGRTGRLICAYFCLRFGHKVPGFRDRETYMDCMENRDIKGLAKYLEL